VCAVTVRFYVDDNLLVFHLVPKNTNHGCLLS